MNGAPAKNRFTIAHPMDWHRCRFLESSDNLRPLIKERFGREPSASMAREIAACLQQGRLFYQAAETSPLEIQPLQLFYGMVGFAKALVVSKNLRSLSTLAHSHGVRDISKTNSRIADLRLSIDGKGTFQEFNDVVAQLTRFVYNDTFTHQRIISLPSAKASEIDGIEMSLRDILRRVPNLDSLYQMTFNEDPYAAPFGIATAFRNEVSFQLQIEDRQLFTDRASLKKIVDGWRARFPFMDMWRLESAQNNWGRTSIQFANILREGVDEFSDSFAICKDGTFQASAQPGDDSNRFVLEIGLSPTAGYLVGGNYAITPISLHHLSEFSLHYLGLFLLSSLVRYRPQTWTHAISRSAIPNEPVDDQALSLVERFLDLNGTVIPELVVTALNPKEDRYF
jgi:hypothetical protein